jgi:nucleoside-diphosphate-sugar epimerase
MSKVLVTGGSGFIGGHCILRLLEAGYEVRTTVRSLARDGEVRATLKAAGAEPGARLELAAADLLSDAGWAEAAAGCEHVLHVASPFPAAAPKHEDELIAPAREGTLRVLRAARDAGCKRVVVTSSFAAIGYGHAPRAAPFDERDWTDTSKPVTAYVRSKTLAERAAWDFLQKEGGALELAVVNPVGVLGPVLGADYASSILLVRRMLDGEVPAVPRLMFGVVDVRDVADLHVRAMTNPAAKGQRFLAVAGDFMKVADAARILKATPQGARVSTRQLPDWLIRLAAPFSAQARDAAPELGKPKNATNEKARRLLGWNPRSREEAIQATAESLARLGLLKKGARG